MHDVACELARAAVRSKDAQKKLARTSLTAKNHEISVYFPTKLILRKRFEG